MVGLAETKAKWETANNQLPMTGVSAEGVGLAGLGGRRPPLQGESLRVGVGMRKAIGLA